MRHSSILLPLLLAVLLLSNQIQAQTIRQKSTTEGLSIGLHGNFMGWSSDYFQFLDEKSGEGPGIGARIGYGLSQRYEPFVQYDYAFLNGTNVGAQSFAFTHLTAGLRVNFSATTHALRPFVEAGYTYQSGKANQILNDKSGRDNLLFAGGAGHVGGGLNYFLSVPIALTFSGSVQIGGKPAVQLNGIDTGEKADVTGVRVSLGVVLFLSEL
jgi:OprF membrane domain